MEEKKRKVTVLLAGDISGTKTELGIYSSKPRKDEKTRQALRQHEHS